MKKRLRKKKVMEVIRHMSSYTDVPLNEVKKTCYVDVEFYINNGNKRELDAYFDSMTIGLMIEHNCGWFNEAE